MIKELYSMGHEGNVSLDKKNGTVKIVLNPRLYSQNVVLRASYRFTEDFDVIVDGDPLTELVVSIKIRKNEKFGVDDLDSIVNGFFAELIHASVEDLQARRYADTRNALIGAALKSMIPDIQKSNENKSAEDISQKEK